MSDTNAKQMRKRLFVDAKVQGALMLRIVLYWVFWVVSISLLLLCWQIVTGPARPFYTHFDSMWFHYGPALVASFVLLPLVLVDLVRLSNRFTGPVLRLRRCMRQVARGEHVEPIHFRDSDFWQEFAVEFNAMLAQMEKPSAAEPLRGASPDCEPLEVAPR